MAMLLTAVERAVLSMVRDEGGVIERDAERWETKLQGAGLPWRIVERLADKGVLEPAAANAQADAPADRSAFRASDAGVAALASDALAVAPVPGEKPVVFGVYDGGRERGGEDAAHPSAVMVLLDESSLGSVMRNITLTPTRPEKSAAMYVYGRRAPLEIAHALGLALTPDEPFAMTQQPRDALAERGVLDLQPTVQVNVWMRGDQVAFYYGDVLGPTDWKNALSVRTYVGTLIGCDVCGGEAYGLPLLDWWVKTQTRAQSTA